MTLLEYVAECLMGPPVKRSNGRSTWHCPYHADAHPSFCTLPPKVGHKDRFRCFSCGAWGDEYDLLKLFYPDEKFGKRQLRLDRLRQDYEQDFLPRGAGSTGSMIQTNSSSRSDEPENVALAWANLMDDLRDKETKEPSVLQILSKAVTQCEKYKVSVRSLIEYWQDFEDWLVDSDRRHLAECNDPDCEAIVCRAARGLPPLTREELDEGRREAEERERVRRAMRNVPKSSTSRRPVLSGRTKRGL